MDPFKFHSNNSSKVHPKLCFNSTILVIIVQELGIQVANTYYMLNVQQIIIQDIKLEFCYKWMKIKTSIVYFCEFDMNLLPLKYFYKLIFFSMIVSGTGDIGVAWARWLEPGDLSPGDLTPSDLSPSWLEPLGPGLVRSRAQPPLELNHRCRAT